MPRNILVNFQHLFWDVEISEVDTAKHAQFVIQRVLEKGDIDALRTLFRTYPLKVIKQQLQKPHNMSARTINFWHIFFANHAAI